MAKNILIFTFLILTFGICASAQNGEKYTYRDLLNQQKIERDELKQTQREILDKILERQKEELKEVSGNTGPVRAMQEKHQTERENLIRIITAERENQLKIQAEERKKFPLKTE